MVHYWRVSKRMAQLVDAGGNVLAVVERRGQREWAGVAAGTALGPRRNMMSVVLLAQAVLEV
jgi:hypothetical protein